MRFRRRLLTARLVLTLAILSVAPSLFAQTALHIVISEVYGGGGNSGSMWKSDFVELYNPTSSPVNLAGWSVQYASATGSAWSVTSLTGTIPAYGHYLVKEAKGSGGTADLPTPDTAGTIAMSATAGKVALVNSTTALTGANPNDPSIVDLIGYGTMANGYEGSGPTPAPSNKTSVERKARSSSDSTKLAAGGIDEFAGNGEDSNNNASNFVVRSTIVPQNSSSEIEGLRVHNTTSDAYFGVIQRAIDQAIASETLDVASGAYSETVSFAKDLTITSEGVPSIVGDVMVDSGVFVTLNASLSVRGNATVGTDGTLNGSGTFEFNSNGIFENNHVVLVHTIIDADGGSCTIAGDGTWSDLTIAQYTQAYLYQSHTWSSSTILIDGTLQLQHQGSYNLTLDGGSLTVSGSGEVSGSTYSRLYTNGNVTIAVDGTFSPLLEVSSGTTSIRGAFPRVQIDNPGSVNLSGATTINDTLNVVGGNLTTGSYTVTLGSSAIIAETAPYSVLGNLTTGRVCSPGVNQTFGGMGIEIYASGAMPGTTTVTRVTGTAPTFPPAVPVKRYFDIVPATNSGLNASMVYHYSDNELNGNNETVLALYKSTDGGSTWTAQGGTVDTGANTVTLAGVSEFSRWIAGGTGNTVPTLSAVSPSTSALGATLDVVLTGTNFADGISAPSFGSEITVNSFTVNSSTQITAKITVSLSAVTGARNVMVTNSPPGGGTGTLENSLTLVNPVPTLTSIDPVAADRGTAPTVALQGSNFVSGVTTVGFGPGITVTSTTVESPAQMRAEIKIGAGVATGSRDVTVRNPSPGGGSATMVSAFTVGNPAPTISSVSPSVGVRGQSVTVTLGGSSFMSGVSSVHFGSGITLNSIVVTTKTQMQVNITIALDATAGPRDVSVTNPAPGGGTFTQTGAFIVQNPVPTLVSITPTSGSRGQTLSVTVTGTNFLIGVTTCSYGTGITVNSVSSVTPTQVTANVTIDLGAATGPRDIAVTNAGPGGGSATLAGAFSVTNPAPTVSGVSPNLAGRGSKLNVMLTGTNFLEGVSTVSFGPDITVNSANITSSIQITVDISISASAVTGARNVTVTNAAPGGGSASIAGGFTVDSSPATGVESLLGVMPNEFVLHEAYPNPFNPSTNIGYGLPERSRVKIEVYNVLGNLVAVLVDGERSEGYYEVEWIAGNLPSGVYLIRLHAESLESSERLVGSRKVVLIK